MSKILAHYVNGNTNVTLLSDGTKIRRTGDDEFRPAFAENMDVKLTDRCDGGCSFCYEGCTTYGKHSDIMNAKWVDSLHAGTELALNFNDMTHPDLIPLLKKLKERKVIPNMTVNQKHFIKYFDTIKKLTEERLVYGVGVSLVDPSDDFISKIKEIPNTVIHTINGILTESDVLKMADNGLKILILGYKHLRRGNDFYNNNESVVLMNQKYLYDNISTIVNHFKCVSFDNLALEQLDIRRLLTQEEWDKFFMGNDSEFTYYIDAVANTFSKNSIAPDNERYPIGDMTVDEMFNFIRHK